MSPKYRHDCTSCKFLGNKGGYDLYFCDQDAGPEGKVTVIARYGDNPEDYASGYQLGLKYFFLPDDKKVVSPAEALGWALRRAVNKRLLSKGGFRMSKKRVLFRHKVDHESAKGEFWIEESPFGADLFIKGANLDDDGNEQSVLGIDLYYGSPMVTECPHNPRPVAQLVLDSAGSDPIGHVRLFARAVGLSLEPMLARSGDLIGNDADAEEINRLRLLKTAKKKGDTK